MVRPLRIEYPGALYHVTSRGNAKQKIYLSDQDRKLFFSVLARVVKDYRWRCHAYCLMGNHYHLLIETLGGNLSQGMRDLNGEYAQAFNETHSRVGHLLQSRYKAFIIEKETYLLEVARYIVLNPVRAKMVQSPEKYAWSSYRSTAGISPKPPFLSTDFILRQFGRQKDVCQKAYRKFIRGGLDVDSPFTEVREGIILGSPQFAFDVWEKSVGSEVKKEISRSERIVARPPLKDLFQKVKTVAQRNAAIRFAKNRCGYLGSEIARYLGIDRSTVGKIVRGTYPKKG